MINMLTWLKSLARSESKPAAGPPLRADVASAELLQLTDQDVGYTLQYSASIELDNSEPTRRRAWDHDHYTPRFESKTGLQWIMQRWVDKQTEELAWQMHLVVLPVEPDMKELPALAHLVANRQKLHPSVQVLNDPQFCMNLPGMSTYTWLSPDSGLQTQQYACLDINEERVFLFTALTHSAVYPVAKQKWETVMSSFQFLDY
jgi:hypothetical protein